MTIPVSRFRRFIAESVLAAFNAKADLMRSGPVPIPTDDFVLELSGTLVDDMGGVGLNEIVRTTQTVTPEGTVTTTVVDPGETTVTTTLPETTTTDENATDSEVATATEASTASEATQATTSDTGSETAAESMSDDTAQEYGRGITTENTYEE